MIEQHYTLSKKDIRQLIWIDYFSYKWNWFRFGFGVIFAITILFVAFYFDSNVRISACAGLFVLLMGAINYHRNKSKQINKEGAFIKDTTVRFEAEDMVKVKCPAAERTFYLNHLKYYTNKRDFILLYVTVERYIVVDKRLLKTEEIEWLVKRLEQLNISKSRWWAYVEG
ncbi:hypothetical protein EMN47_19530 [Prolixibacteraceae bacterium JC049]|nr:hypothetical protein [Prolixibacteraceae bacterium JC049]